MSNPQLRPQHKIFTFKHFEDPKSFSFQGYDILPDTRWDEIKIRTYDKKLYDITQYYSSDIILGVFYNDFRGLLAVVVVNDGNKLEIGLFREEKNNYT